MFKETSELIKKKHSIIRKINNYDYKDKKEKQILEKEVIDLNKKYIEKTKTSIDNLLKKTKIIETTEQVKMASGKELKKRLEKKYKIIREEYAHLQQLLKENVNKKKQFRLLIDATNKLKDKDSKKNKELKKIEIFMKENGI